MKKQLTVPAIGQTFSRDLMPQIGPESIKDFQKYLKAHGIGYNMAEMPTDSLKATQSEFDGNKIIQLMGTKNKDPIITSKDDHVLDGHHRWLANHNSNIEKTKCCQIDLPILELVRVAKEYRNVLNESLTHKDFGPMMDSFVSFASDKLGIKSIPKISYKTNDDQGTQPSFGGYNPSSQEIIVCTKNRHPMDVFRTVAHELVHHMQNENDKIKDISKEGATGSPIEDEANSMAGRLMRWFAKANPNTFTLSHIVEQDINFDAHNNVTFRITDPEGDPSREGFSIVTPENGEAWSGPNAWKERPEFHAIVRQKINEPGFLAHKRGQIERSAEKIGLPLSGMPQNAFESTLKEDLRKWFREKWVRFDTKGKIKGQCAKDEGEGKPKCLPLAKARALGKEARAKAAKRKRREDPVADRSGKGEKPVFVKTEEYLMEKNVPTNPELWARAKSLAKQKFDVYPSAYANGWASKWYKGKGGGWKSKVDEMTNYKGGEAKQVTAVDKEFKIGRAHV